MVELCFFFLQAESFIVKFTVRHSLIHIPAFMEMLYTKSCKYLSWSVAESCRCRKLTRTLLFCGLVEDSKNLFHTPQLLVGCVYLNLSSVCDEKGIKECVLIVLS